MWKSFYFSHSDADVSSCSVEKTETCNFIKNETLAQVFSCEFCEISKNSFFTANLRWLRPSLFMQTYCSEYFSETSTTYFLHEKKTYCICWFPYQASMKHQYWWKCFFGNVFYQRRKCTRKWTLNIKFKKMVNEALSIL